MTRFTIEVEIDGDPARASSALGAALAANVLQDAVEESGGVHVASAAVTDERELDATLTRFTVEVEVDGARSEASEAVDDALDTGALQDAVRAHGGVTVDSAVVVLEQEVRI